jgi:hypothetical protein
VGRGGQIRLKTESCGVTGARLRRIPADSVEISDRILALKLFFREFMELMRGAVLHQYVVVDVKKVSTIGQS